MLIPVLLLTLGLAQAVSPLSVTHAARAIQQGEVVVLTITGAAKPVDVRAFGRRWPASGDGPGRWQALIGIDLDAKPGRYEVTVTSGDTRVTHPLLVSARVFPTRRLKVDPALVHPPPEERERIDREAREIAAIWEASPPERLWTAPFVRPVPDPANSAFGTHSVYNGEPASQHAGADFLSPAGRPVKAPNGGRVVLAGPRYFSGNTVVIDHGQGVFSLLAHLSEIDVQPGAPVAAGDVVGKVGATGRVTGPHLHWTLRVNGARVDPLSLLFVLGTASPGQIPPGHTGG